MRETDKETYTKNISIGKAKLFPNFIPEISKDCKQAALLYASLNISVIPLKENSVEPAIFWEEFQKRIITTEEIEKLEWKNIGIVTGSLSKLVVFEIQGEEAEIFYEKISTFYQTAFVKTKTGMHFYVKVSDLQETIKSEEIVSRKIRINIKANQDYIIAPPSVVNGCEYKWEGRNIVEISSGQLISIITKLKNMVESREREKNDIGYSINESINEVNLKFSSPQVSQKVNEREESELISNESDSSKWINKNWKLYHVTKKKSIAADNTEIAKVPVGEYFEILGKYIDPEKKTYHVVIKHRDELYYDIELTPENLSKIFKTPVLSEGLYKIFIFDELERAENKGIGWILDRTGWFEEKSERHFLTPCFKTNNEKEIIFNEYKMKETFNKFKIKKGKNFHEFWQKILEKGDYPAVLYTVAISAILLYRINSSILINISGESIQDLSILCRAICNAFYDNFEPPFISTNLENLNHLLYQLTDLPVYLHEPFLSREYKSIDANKEELQQENTIKYEYFQGRNVLLITSDREVPNENLKILAENIHICLAIKDMNLMRALRSILNHRFSGWGYDYVEFFHKNRDLIIPNYSTSKLNSLLLDGLNLLERFYNKTFPVLEKKILELCHQNQRKIDLLNYGLESLIIFYKNNIQNFYTAEQDSQSDSKEENKQNISDTFYGFKKDNFLYLTAESFDKFCKEHNIEREKLIKLSKDKGILKANDKNRYKFRKLPIPIHTNKRRFYAFELFNEI